MAKPLVIDLCCGLGGWTRGFLAEGYDAIGFDIEKHEYGDKKYPAELILKDITTICGYDLLAVNPVMIVASPPCQAYSYRAMPWKRAKALPPPDNTLFNACFRIAREAGCPIVVENVKGAQPWVGRAAWHYGSYYLWGDVPAIMPMAMARKGKGGWFGDGGRNDPRDLRLNADGDWMRMGLNEPDGLKVPGITWNGHGKPGYKGQAFNGTAAQRYREECGVKQEGSGRIAKHSSRSDSRKAASAMIAEIPFDLAQWVARVFKPGSVLHAENDPDKRGPIVERGSRERGRRVRS